MLPRGSGIIMMCNPRSRLNNMKFITAAWFQVVFILFFQKCWKTFITDSCKYWNRSWLTLGKCTKGFWERPTHFLLSSSVSNALNRTKKSSCAACRANLGGMYLNSSTVESLIQQIKRVFSISSVWWLSVHIKGVSTMDVLWNKIKNSVFIVCGTKFKALILCYGPKLGQQISQYQREWR